ncbi:MAG: hypothetical protein DRO90_02735 [Candidatus Altiarchaeales archaeon]|nr:MAG: hypothetical protein DRO95_03640 [Candidatus Altiarchaeales archaeon]RLI93821.1 MAG: hypothetical protein DRO94_04360 [Candidatus Altiarchaeales archaeon]RLI93994.1 MAG: hypothetical protein DRO90_02735 [Candidatus Altiarchaeales archaeon]HDO82772.1 DUF357 domain-containing protein [Candidatus Altiarchaeales archaeon]HEX55421.1 DUF357 domain-containing protein [Candidatus Altiarchaeales archaeon]
MCDNNLKIRISEYLKRAKPWFENLHVVKVKGIDEKRIDEFYTMAISYYKDSIHFYNNGDYINSLSALEYAEGWLDAGKCIGIFKIKK